MFETGSLPTVLKSHCIVPVKKHGLALKSELFPSLVKLKSVATSQAKTVASVSGW